MTIEMQMMQVRAPAKINLSLKILGRRADGFHEIETLIVPVSLCDEIKIDNSSCSFTGVTSSPRPLQIALD
ncbi:MAG: hypothetical protein DME50_14135 [Verrucomicrobia bacterium]|nr:MAG: hypothetical protein DME50_14135 [Verrucomicrobiota bacterium]